MHRRKIAFSKISQWILIGLALVQSSASQALVGQSFDARETQRHVVMVLARSNTTASFCTGTVLTRTIVLTAAHCVADRATTRVFIKDDAGQQRLLEISNIAVHPGYEKDAARLRRKSIDLALVQLQLPLPSMLIPLPVSQSSTAGMGDQFVVAGFGMTQENQPKTGGTLRKTALQVRAPLSNVLLWLEGVGGAQDGACTGDSGAPVLDASGTQLLAVVAFAAGRAGHACGQLTQAILIAPQRAWIDQILQRWGQ